MKGTAYLVQGTLVALWWLGLAVSQSFYEAFQFPGISKIAFNSFFLPDVFVITLLSIIRAYRVNRELELIILGGFAYGSLYCINASLLSSGGYLASSIMFLGLFYNLFLVYQSKIFRESNSQKTVTNGLKTFFQIICVWLITLFLFPWFIIDGFKLIETISLPFKIISYTIFGLASILGLSSAVALVKHGKGTPLPVDQTKALVVSGPYALIRNPMALAGLCQGFAIALYFESLHLLIYTLLGGFLWQFIVRPIEEKNMTERFGKAYKDYQRKVNLWLPKLSNRSR